MHMSNEILHDDPSLDEEINALISKYVREGGLADGELARFQHLTAQRSLSRRPRFDRKSHSKLRFASV